MATARDFFETAQRIVNEFGPDFPVFYLFWDKHSFLGSEGVSDETDFLGAFNQGDIEYVSAVDDIYEYLLNAVREHTPDPEEEDTPPSEATTQPNTRFQKGDRVVVTCSNWANDEDDWAIGKTFIFQEYSGECCEVFYCEVSYSEAEEVITYLFGEYQLEHAQPRTTADTQTPVFFSFTEAQQP